MQIEYSKTAAKALQRMEKDLRNRIHDGIIGLTETPPRGDIKPLQGYKDGRYRLRIGGYRVVYRYDSRGTIIVLVILDVGARGDVYK